MRVGIDLSWLRLGKVGGAEQATHAWLQALAAIKHDHHYVLHSPRATYGEWLWPGSFSHDVVLSDRIVRERSSLRSPYRPAEKDPFTSCDLVHAPSGYLPEKRGSGRLVVTVHDLQQLHYPQYFSPDELAHRSRQWERILSSADHLICISDFTRADVLRHFSWSPSRVSVAWPALASGWYEEMSASTLRKVADRLRLPGRFAFFPSHPWSHKNHLRLLEAWSRAGLDRDWPLVFSGAPWPVDHEAAALRRKAEAAGWLRHVGLLSPLELQVVMRSAALLVFPSLFEGFGLPVAEAMCVGTPVVCARRGSLPEIAGSAAAYFDPDCLDDMARVISRVARDDDERAQLRQLGFQRASLFWPVQSARHSIEVYRQVLGLPTVPWPADITQPIRSTLRFERFRHHARRAERAARNGRWISSAGSTAIACLLAPSHGFRRLVAGAFCHLEVFFRRKFASRSVISPGNLGS